MWSPIFDNRVVTSYSAGGKKIAKEIEDRHIFLKDFLFRVLGVDETSANDAACRMEHAMDRATFKKFNLTCMHIYHSIGKVKAGEICLFVFVSSPRRKEVFKALEYIVEEIKAKVPVFGKELFEDESHQWKVNS